MRKNNKMQYNPTTYFFEQAEQVDNQPNPEIQKLVSQLIDTKCCMLCKETYNFTLHLPRILVHCGHTFCHACLTKFHKNHKIRCPVCLKLIRNIEKLERLPVNHTIFALMVEDVNQKVQEHEKINLQDALVNQFVTAQNIKPTYQQPENNFNLLPREIIKQVLKQAPRVENLNQAKIDPEVKRILKNKKQEEELSLCEYHKERVNHFFCLVHKTVTCRVCTQVMHGKEECAIIDFYDIEDIGIKNFLSEAIFINPLMNDSQQDQNNFMSDQDVWDSEKSHS